MKNVIKKAIPYFEAYKDEQVFYATSDGQYFAEKNKSAANSHQRSLKVKDQDKAIPVTRVEAMGTGGEDADAGTSPASPAIEGTPDESWTIPQIQAWLDAKEVKYASNAKEANLLGKVAEYLKSQE